MKYIYKSLYLQVYGEASIIFPLLVAETFARHHQGLELEKEKTTQDVKD